MAALALTGVGVLLIAVLVDVPHLNDTGVWPLSDQYEDASASAGIGFYFETASGVLMLLGGVMALLVSPRGAAAPEAPRPVREAPAPAAEPATSPAPVADDPMAPRAQRLTQPQTPPKRRQSGLMSRLRNKD
jgi:hypothetical protein